MASYHEPYDYYDYHPRPSRSARPQHGSYSDRNEDIYTHMSGNSTTSHRYAENRYDPRYHYPSPHSGRAAPSPRAPRQRRSWPPPPCAEDAIVSLRKESNAQELLQEISRDEAPARGAVDQEPLIQDTELVNMYERRFVLAESSRSAGGPTPPTSEDEKARRAARRPSKLDVHDLGISVPEVAKRTSSPYAFSKQSASLGDHFLSPASITPPSATVTRTGKAETGPPSPRQDYAHLSPAVMRGKEYINAVDDNVIDDAGDSSGLNAARKRAINAPLTSSPSSTTFDFASPQIRRANLDSRRNTDTQTTLPTLGRLNLEECRRPTPLMASHSLSEAHDSAPIFSSSLNAQPPNPRQTSLENSRASSRGVSPASSTGRRNTTRSSRMSSEYSYSGSKPPSAGTSRPGTPPRVSKESTRLPKTDLDWSNLLAANAARRTQPPPRLASSMPGEAEFEVPHRSTHEASPRQFPSSLPYPEDTSMMGSTVLMPQEHEHAYYPSKQNTNTPTFAYPSTASSASGCSSGSSKMPHAPSSLSSKPCLTRGYSASPETRPSDSRPRRSEAKRESFASSSQAKKDLAGLVKRGLPPCPRQEPVAGLDDWYTVTGATNIDFCPDCIGTLFERTFFRPLFRRSLPRNLDTKVQCAFGSPWIRLAWLLTLQQQRTDLALLKDVAEIEATTARCPGSVQTAQSWYGLRDSEGLFVRDFHLCYGDVRKIERLLPTLSGFFVRLPHRASYEKHVCAIRTDSNRFSAYLDALVNTHENALSSRKGADSVPLIDIIEQKTRLRECTRDNMLIGGLWHFAPDIPTFTICEDCFEEVVEPQIKKNVPLAKIFQRTVQPVYGEGIGSSCQLYSRRMRKVFQRSMEDNDFSYLARKSKERREAELWLQEKYKDVMRKAKRLSLEGAVSEDDERSLQALLEKISTIWKLEWE